MQLPRGLSLELLQTKWAAIINPFLGNPSLSSIILPSVALASGTTAINHRLGRALTGWRIIRIDGAATIYDAQATNQTPSLTLVLVSSAAVTCSIEVF